MLRPIIAKVTPLSDYRIYVEFDNGEKGTFDVWSYVKKPYIKGDWYGKLRMEEYFNKIRTEGVTVCWPDGQDICPDELSDDSKKHNVRESVCMKHQQALFHRIIKMTKKLVKAY